MPPRAASWSSWSENSIESTWCRAEANDSLDRGILVSVLIDDVRPPLRFRKAQTQFLADLSDPDEALASFLEGINAYLKPIQVGAGLARGDQPK